MKKNKLVWRLGKLPSVAELQELVKDKIITNEEAREILFNEQTEEDVDKDSLKSEIKFLRELVQKLSKGNTTKVVEYIYSKPYNYGWYTPYVNWCSTLVGSQTMTSASLAGYASSSDLVAGNSGDVSFTDVETF